MGQAKLTIYEALRLMADRTGFRTAEDQADVIEAIDSIEAVNAFGIIASMQACTHPSDMRGTKTTTAGRGVYVTICTQCGKENP